MLLFYGVTGTLENRFVMTDDIKFAESTFTTLPQQIANADFSQVTDLSGLFRCCENLTSVPQLDISNVENLGGMFDGCSNLEEVSLFDTSGATTMGNMFSYCSSLEEIPQFNTSNVENMFYMCSECSSLVTIPVLDTSNVTSFDGAFAFCPNLSNESLNNILEMCINATNFTLLRTLQHLGLSQEQAQICTTLSNYQDFIDAGWTTGY